jgi:hypothetical protein
VYRVRAILKRYYVADISQYMVHKYMKEEALLLKRFRTRGASRVHIGKIAVYRHKTRLASDITFIKCWNRHKLRVGFLMYDLSLPVMQDLACRPYTLNFWFKMLILLPLELAYPHKNSSSYCIAVARSMRRKNYRQVSRVGIYNTVERPTLNRMECANRLTV